MSDQIRTNTIQLQANEIECNQDQYDRYHDYVLEKGKIVHAPLIVPLEKIQSEMKRRVDDNAEAERLNYITPGNGQAMTYQQKVAEAQAFKAATSPHASDYPILLSEVGITAESEVGITAETLNEVADVVLAAFAQWQQIGAMIEAIRLGAKRDIDLAEDEASARVIIDAIIWPSQVQP